ncbi:unnamed protein product [Discula destructiva]
MSTSKPIQTIEGVEQPPVMMEAERNPMGNTFPDSPIPSAQHGTAITSPFDLDLGESALSPPARAITRIQTPRPHLFPNLEAARDHVYRKSSDTRSASRSASAQVSQTPSEDEPSPRDMNPPPSTRAFGRSLTGRAESPSRSPPLPALPAFLSSPAPGFHPISTPVIWEDVPRPLNTSSSRDVSSTLPSASQISGSSVDNIICHYGQRSSSAAQSQAAMYDGSSSHAEMDRFIGQDQGATEGNVETGARRGDAAKADLRKGDHGLMHKALDKSAPSGPPPTLDAPLHPSNPFFTSRRTGVADPQVPSTSSVLSPLESLPLLRETSTPGIQHDRAKRGSDLEMASVETSSLKSVSVAESRVGPMHNPSHMHSVRRQQRGRPSLASHATYSTGRVSEATSGSGFNDDPFKYDNGGPFLHPSRERVVSANLRKVSGLPRESTATVYSQDGTPSRTFYGETAAECFGLDGDLPSGSPGRALRDASPVQAQSRNPPSRNLTGNVGANVTRSFYDSTAIKPDWASGKPDVVRVPVANNGSIFGSEKKSGRESSRRPGKQVGLEALHRRDGDKRITGNTED